MAWIEVHREGARLNPRVDAIETDAVVCKVNEVLVLVKQDATSGRRICDDCSAVASDSSADRDRTEGTGVQK